MLVFVYNAKSGMLNLLLDVLHKAILPATYPCKLCALTYSTIGMRPQWRTFINTLNPYPKFLHRDELKSKYGIENVALPAIYKLEGDSLTLWISSDAINACDSLQALQDMVTKKLSEDSSH